MRFRKVLLNKYVDDFNKKCWTIEQMNEGIRLLKDIKQILDLGGIPFYLFFGTLLGIYRDGKLIDWDVDCDIALKHEDYEGVIDREEEFEKLGCEEYGIERDDFLTIYRNHIHCDVYFFKERSEGRKHRGIVLPENTFGDNTIKWQDDSSWKLVTNPEGCLEILYGKDWKVPDPRFKHSYNTLEFS